MEATPSERGHDGASRIDYEILRLKHEIGFEDARGHSCEQCKGLKIKPPLESDATRKQLTEYKFFEIHTTGRKIRALAETGCDFWIMIRDQLTYIDLEAMVEQQHNKVTLDSKKRSEARTDESYRVLAKSLGVNEEQEFWRLRRQRGASWTFDTFEPTMGVRVTEADFVLISMGYSYFYDKPITVLLELIVPQKPTQTIPDTFPRRTDGGLQLVKYWTMFLALRLPGMYSSLG